MIKQIISHFFTWQKTFKNKKPITVLDISIFLRQFSTLISSGIPLIKSCEILEKSQEKMALRLLIYSLKKEMLGGKNLFHSMSLYPHYFNEFTRQLIKIGEHTGKLGTLLMTIAHHHEKNLAFKKRIKQTLFYPGLTLLLAMMVTGIMLMVVIPRFAELFQDKTAQLPLLTVTIFYFSSVLNQHSSYFFSLLILALVILFYLKDTAYFKQKRSLLIKLPIISYYHRKFFFERFARNLSISLNAGLPIIEALKLITEDQCHEFTMLMIKLRHKISTGVGLYDAMESLACFPELMIQMIKIGEECGMLDQMLYRIADFLEAEIEQLFIRFSLLLEPLIMVILGVLIGGLVIGMYLPIFKLGNTL